MFRRASSEPEITRKEVSDTMKKLMSIDDKLERIIDHLEIDDGEEETGD